MREVAFRFAAPARFFATSFRALRPADEWVAETMRCKAWRADAARARAEDVEWHRRIESDRVGSRSEVERRIVHFSCRRRWRR